MVDSKLPIASAPSGGDPDPLSRIGEVIDGRYELLEFIGQGGMGNVYRGQHITIKKPIALKLLHPSLAGIPELRSRFEREAFAIGRIEHPNCVMVSDFGELADGSLFLAMEYLNGESAADLLDRERPLAPERALKIVRDVLLGLGHAHRVGIVHRDIKPENIFVVQSGDDRNFAKVLDFGIAKLLDDAKESDGGETLTQAGITFGTPAYLSPEQAIGEPADARSDLYSVGVVLYELLTGLPPFRAPDKMELLAMHANKEAPSLADAAPLRSFSREIERLVARGLEKRRSKRFQAADEFVAAIDALGLFPRPASYAESDSESIARHVTPLPTRAGSFAPTELASQPTPKIPWPLIGIASGAIAIVILTLVVLGSRSATLAGIKRAKASEVAKEARAQRESGKPEEALEVLKKDSSETDPSAQLELGHNLAIGTKYEEAVQAYAKALLLDANSIRDSAMVANLRLMIDDSGPIYFEAARLLVEYAKDEGATKRLIALAAHADRDTRKKAFAMAETMGFGDQVDRAASFILDLEQEPTCEERKEAVTKLRALGDARAIKPLEEARERLSKKTRKRKRTNLNSCLAASARDAARFLASQAPRAPEPGSPAPN